MEIPKRSGLLFMFVVIGCLVMSGCSSQLYTAIFGSEGEAIVSPIDQMDSVAKLGNASSSGQQETNSDQLPGESLAIASYNIPSEPPPLPRGIDRGMQAEADAAGSMDLQGDPTLNSPYLRGEHEQYNHNRGQGLLEEDLVSRRGSQHDGAFSGGDSQLSGSSPGIATMNPSFRQELSPLKEEDLLEGFASSSKSRSPDAQVHGGFASFDQRGASVKELADVFFDFDAALIRSDAGSVLEVNAALLKTRYPNKPLIIEGHCDERGSQEYNLVLGERRAHATKQYLVDLGIPISSIQTVSYGKEKPFCTASQPECWNLNRRGHFVLQ